MDSETRFPALTLGKSLKSAKMGRYYWPNAEASIGKHYKNANLGRNQCWEAIGDARKKFQEIASEIKIHLEKCSDPVAEPVTWTMYMIGRNRKESIPTIVFCGRDKKARIKVKEMINESGIMDRHPGVRMGSLTEEFQHYAEAEPAVRTHIGTAVSAGKAVLFFPSDTGPGMRILLQGFHGDSSLRPATGGGFICHRGSIFLTTVAHAFHEDAANALPGPPGDYDIEFELDGDSEEDEDDSEEDEDDSEEGEDDIEMLSIGSVSPEPSDLGDSAIFGSTSSDTSSEFGERSINVSATDQFLSSPGACRFPVQNSVVKAPTIEPGLPVLTVGEHIILSTTGSRPGLDYCLVEIRMNELLKFEQIFPKFNQSFRPVLNRFVISEPKNVDVIASTGSGGLLKGRLSGTPSFLMLPTSNIVQEVWAVRHDTEVFNGDCGSWVLDASNGDLFGHLIGGSPSMNVSYIIPAHLILADLKERFDGEWEPYSRDRKPVGGSKSSPFLNLTPNREWNPIFMTRREDFQYARENERFIESRDWEEEGLVLAFMKNNDESDSYLHRVAKVEEYCFGATLEALQEEGKADRDFIALLDERSSVGKREQSRGNRGPLTARRLYQELRKPRFHIGGSTRTNSKSERAATALNPYPGEEQLEESEPEPEPEPEPDAERRKIFITNLDRWGIYALISTASESQAPGLRDAIYKHLAFKNFISVTFPPSLATFQLAFHIPFYAWRMGDPRDDHRLNSNAERLRKSRDVSFLNWKSSGPSDFLYEAQYSCLITGTDEWHWDAYGFFDTYFDDPDEVKETIEGYGEEGTLVDPFTFGATGAEQAIPTPREYWLCVFRLRIAHVLREWERVVSKIEESIRENRQIHIRSLVISRDRSIPTANKGYDEMVRRSRDWVVHLKILTRELLQHLSKTVDACKKFCDIDAVYFQNLPDQKLSDQTLPAIRLIFDRLESLEKDLKYSLESCEDFAQDLELLVILESSRMSNVQSEIAKDDRRLLFIIMLYISPIALSAAILSMNSDTISFIPSSFSSFLGLVIIFSIFGILVRVGLQYQSQFWQALMDLAGQQRRKEHCYEGPAP